MGTKRLKMLLLAAGDVAAAYAALAATLLLRYGTEDFAGHWRAHLFPFSLAFALWLVIFYIVGLYDHDRFRNRLDLLTRAAEAIPAAFLVSLAIFYFVAEFKITPKTNLAIATAVFAALFVGWRLAALHLYALERFRRKIAFVGRTPEADDLCETVRANPQLGFSCLGVFDGAASLPAADVIVVDERKVGAASLFGKLFDGASILDLEEFHEAIRREVPQAAMNEAWVLRHVGGRELSTYEHFKRPLEAAAAAALMLPAAAFFPFLAAAIWLEDRGPVFYSQARVGRGGRTFRIHKLRTMRVNAEANGAAFAEHGDPRVTRVGRFLRASRLDELPQLWNILKGEMSFVGPRPERPEFEAELAKTMPLFPVRHLVRPGLTGWAQVNAPYAASKDDHAKKLRHDLYYLKHQSLMLDLAILLRTIYSVLKRQGR